MKNGTYTSWCIRYSWVMTGMTSLNRGCRCRLIGLIYRMAKRGIEIEDVKKISWQMQSDTRRRKRYAMSEKRSCEWRVTPLTCGKKLIVIACVLEVIRVRRTLVWCYLDVCTAIELIVLCFMVLSSEVLCCLFFVPLQEWGLAGWHRTPSPYNGTAIDLDPVKSVLVRW